VYQGEEPSEACSHCDGSGWTRILEDEGNGYTSSAPCVCTDGEKWRSKYYPPFQRDMIIKYAEEGIKRLKEYNIKLNNKYMNMPGTVPKFNSVSYHTPPGFSKVA